MVRAECLFAGLASACKFAHLLSLLTIKQEKSKESEILRWIDVGNLRYIACMWVLLVKLMIVVMVINTYRSSSGSILLHKISIMWYCFDLISSRIKTPQTTSFGFFELHSDSLIFIFFCIYSLKYT